MVKLASVSSMWTGSGSPSRASAAASPSSLSSSQASPVSVANRTERDNSSVVSGGAALNVAYLIGETKVLAVHPALARSTLDGCSGGGHGAVHQAVRRSSRLGLSLLRSHCHSRLPERTITA